jgi:hypothetical protein
MWAGASPGPKQTFSLLCVLNPVRISLAFLQEYPSVNFHTALPLALNFSASGESCARNEGPSLRQRTVRGMF